MIKYFTLISLMVVLMVPFISVCQAQTLAGGHPVFNEKLDSSLTKPLADSDLPDLFDAKVQVMTTAVLDSVDEVVNGFRVQIYKTETITDSKEKQTLYTEMFGEGNVKLIFEEPFYKIRIGSFRTRNEAENFQDDLMRNGFRTTIVVPDKVTLRVAKKAK